MYHACKSHAIITIECVSFFVKFKINIAACRSMCLVMSHYDSLTCHRRYISKILIE